MTSAEPLLSVPLLSVRGLVKHFPVRKGLLQRTVGQVHAVDGISFDIAEGETLGLVGESGCGKSTAGKTILKLIDPTAGEVRIGGKRIDGLSRREMRPYRRQLQVVFQDPYSSLNPRLRIRDIIGEPLVNYGVSGGRELEDRVEGLALKVGLRAEALDRFPHEFSGGQRQRIGIARALALHPSLIVCDEPVSALDVSVQAQVINLLADSAKRVRALLPLRRPRFGGGRAHQPPHRGHVSRQDRRARRQARPLHPPAAPLHRGPLVGGAGPRPRGGAPAHHPQRRRAEPDQPALGLPLSYPLPLHLHPLLQGGAGDARDPARSPCRLPSARCTARRARASRGRTGGNDSSPSLIAGKKRDLVLENRCFWLQNDV